MKRGHPFWLKVAIMGPDECWLWLAHISKDGYGRYYYDGSMRQAHRKAYQLHHGHIDPRLHVLHSCDRKPCQNPRHLFQGTDLDNMHDLINKGRYRGWNARFA